MKRLFDWWYIPFVFFGALIVLYIALIGYRIAAGESVVGGNTGNQNSDSGFWSNITNSIGLSTKKLKGEREGRINVMLVGVSGGENAGPDLTDSLIFASVDTKNKKIDMFSIPRDLYLEVPGFGYSKINAAYSLGKNYQAAGGGIDLLKDTVSEVLNQNIDYYVKIDFEGFVKIIDALGGVDVVVDEDLYDNLYPDGNYGYQVFSLTKGKQHLDGETALMFARSRETTSDFDRSKRQQKLLLAMKQAFLSKGAIGGAKLLIQLVDIVSKNLETDVKVWEWERIATLAKDWGDDLVVKNHAFDNSAEGFLVDGNIDGMYVLQPYGGDFSLIKEYVAGVLSGKGDDSNKKFTFDVLNGTNRVGLASKASEVLKQDGYEVGEVGNSDEVLEKSTAYCRDGKDMKDTVKYLEKQYGFEVQQNGQNEDLVNVDCKLILGNNFSISEE